MQRKAIFDTVRDLLGRGFTKDEVATLDRAIDRAIERAIDRAVDRAIDEAIHESEAEPVRLEPRRIGLEGVSLINQFEGCARKRSDGMVEAYPDPGTGGDPWTIGWGATHMLGRRVCRGDVISQDQADSLLEEHLQSYAAEVVKALNGAPTSPSQFDALVSFHYNTGAIGRATLIRKHCAGDYEGAAREFSRWTRAGGKVLRGLVRRREAEAELYRRGC